MGFFDKLFGVLGLSKTKCNILVVGLDDAGKTTIMNQIMPKKVRASPAQAHAPGARPRAQGPGQGRAGPSTVPQRCARQPTDCSAGQATPRWCGEGPMLQYPIVRAGEPCPGLWTTGQRSVAARYAVRCRPAPAPIRGAGTGIYYGAAWSPPQRAGQGRLYRAAPRRRCSLPPRPTAATISPQPRARAKVRRRSPP